MASSGLSSEDDLRPALPPPRFGLMFMFLVITAVGLILVANYYWSGLGVAGTALIFSVLAAHFIGSSLGVRLQKNGSIRPKTQGKPAPVTVLFARTTSLSQRRRHNFPVVATSLVVGAVFAIAGSTLFCFVYGERIAWVAIGAGAIAFFVVGAIASFVVISFVTEAVHAMNDATRDD